MAGTSHGAIAPNVSTSLTSPSAGLSRVALSTRTRRNHGVFLLGNKLATVYSSRRASDGLGVTLSLGNGSPTITLAMTPTQARAVARALVAAASAVEVQGGTA